METWKVVSKYSRMLSHSWTTSSKAKPAAEVCSAYGDSQSDVTDTTIAQEVNRRNELLFVFLDTYCFARAENSKEREGAVILDKERCPLNSHCLRLYLMFMQ